MTPAATSRARSRAARALASALFLLALAAGSTPPRAGGGGGPREFAYPAPRYPKIPEVNRVEQLLPFVRHIVERPMPYSGDQRPGLGIKGGEKILFVTDSDLDPLVLEAFLRVLRDEKKCRVDVFQEQGRRRLFRTEEVMRYLVDSPPSPRMLGGPEWTQALARREGYDKVVGQIFWEETNCRVPTFSYSMDWPTREQLASPAVTYPEEIIEAIDRAAWKVLRETREVHLTDPEGTDLRFTWLDEYWRIMDGSFPGYPIPPTEGFGTHRYRPGATKDPLISGHLAGYPLGVVLPKSDVTGVIAGTSDHLGPYPHLRIRMERNKVTRLEGGGEFGDKWREFIEKNKAVKYPHYPGPGVDWFIEAAIGTHPKVIRPFNVFESATARASFMSERDRSGVMHLGIGQLLDFAWALRHDPPLPFYHFHVHLYFPTYTCKLRDGREVKLIDRGRLTALDDPEVRRVAAKYGDPDELLREDWVPALSGVNTQGDYLKDYAADPESYMRLEHRRAYGEAIERSRAFYK
ncbi:MAG TPA: hypothetical protein VN228_13410 [Pyrinomonadaceae bacterium]|nr:hypothetical protein [Pyrinomonadaceae bacterium]